ncbi:hypothetical protein EVG20_g2833 [Dentipellis fragilis]|uniref:Uncharacterized protein n=1 Tax=Dentipellis fragilis TaxID=205917 RepID=A0A4Y9Z8M0_9AGAM|nr:hypothetical protein EVG20_g2833 [Dentipellis fragilis]
MSQLHDPTNGVPRPIAGAPSLVGPASAFPDRLHLILLLSSLTMLLPSTLLFLLSLPLAWATPTDTCNPARNGLTSGTLQYRSDCNATTWCNNGVCQPKGCRKDEFPLGWPKNITLVDKCKSGTFCPDEGSSCQPLIPVGSPCQFDRDDECQAPDNFQELRDTSGRGLNVNGSICLNFVCQWAWRVILAAKIASRPSLVLLGQTLALSVHAETLHLRAVTKIRILSIFKSAVKIFMEKRLGVDMLGTPWANVSVGQQCEIENTGYVAYAPGGNEFGFVVSRDNCKLGMYCDSQQRVCIQEKDLGASCGADKEYVLPFRLRERVWLTMRLDVPPTTACPTTRAAAPVEDPRDVKKWVYIVVGVGIFGGMFATLVIFFFLHGRARDVEREKRLQYWREQNAFRQNIMQMRETARASIFTATNSQRNTMYSRDGAASEDSHAPMLQNAAAHAATKGSGLRYYVSDDGTYEQEPEDFDDDKKY